MVNRRLVFRPLTTNQDPNAWVLRKDLLTSQECSDIIKMGESMKFEHSTIGYERSEDSSHRDCSVSWIEQEDQNPVVVNLWNKLMETIQGANYQAWRFNLSYIWDKIQYTVYEEGNFFNYHMDLGARETASRKISCSVLLNDPSEFEGGEFQFYEDRPVTLTKGDIVVFPSFLMHRVTPVTKGVRKSLVLWAGGSFYQ